MLTKFFLAKKAHTLDSFIFHKIVDELPSGNLLLHCINTGATFDMSAIEIAFDLSVLKSLHPTQACYIGLECSSAKKWAKIKSKLQNRYDSFMPRYGKLNLNYTTRNGYIGFIDVVKNESHCMYSKDLALSNDIMKEFDAINAFYIGFVAGQHINRSKSIQAIKDNAIQIERNFQVVG